MHRAYMLYELVFVKNSLGDLIKQLASVSHSLKWHFLFCLSTLW